MAVMRGARCKYCGVSGLAWGSVGGKLRLCLPLVKDGIALTKPATFTRPDKTVYAYKRYVADTNQIHRCVGQKPQVPEPKPFAGAPEPKPDLKPEPEPAALPTPKMEPEPEPKPESVLPSPDPARVDAWAAVERMVRSVVNETLDALMLPQRHVVEIRNPAGKIAELDLTHSALPAVVSYIHRRVHCYLMGPAGSGKTYGAGQAAQAVGLRSAVIAMPGLTVGRLFGFENAAGIFVSTVFTDYFENGGVLVMDEFDRLIPAVGTALNAALENRRTVFGGREVQAHPDFVVVATGNTDMRGATRAYTGAQPVDMATAARFAFVNWDYDRDHESKLVHAAAPDVAIAAQILTWGRKVRAALRAERQDMAFAGPRELLRIAQDVAAGVPLADAQYAWVWRGLPADMQQRIEGKAH